MYEIAICDDSLTDSIILKNYIISKPQYRDMIRFHLFDSGEKMLLEMDNIRFSIIFMDIQMEGMDGEQTAEEVRKIDDSVILVFYTGCAEPTMRSFEVQPFRFIKKNMSEEHRNRYIEDSLEKMAELAQMPVIMAKMSGKKLFLKPDDIVYIEKYKKTTRVHISQSAKIRYHIKTIDNEEVDIRNSEKLVKLYQLLMPHGFGWPHDSYIINFKYMMSCTDHEIMLEGYNEIIFRITRSKAVTFNHLKKKFLTSKYRREME